MKPVFRSWSSDERATHDVADGDRRPPAGAPTPGEVLTEAGLLLAIHLAVAFAVALTLRLCGIA
jgi:hypothetical protein